MSKRLYSPHLKSRKLYSHYSEINEGPIQPIQELKEGNSNLDLEYKPPYITAVGYQGETVEFLSEDEVEICPRCKCYFVRDYWIKGYEDPVCYICHQDDQ